MWRKILGWFILIVLFGGSICGVVFGLKYNNLKNTNAEQKYDALLSKYNELQDSYDKLIKKYDDINSQLYTLNLENKSNKKLVAELAEDKAMLEEEKAQLETQADADAEIIADLQSQIVGKNTEIENLNAVITANNEAIATLEAEKLSLQNEITRLNGLLAGYEDIKNGIFEVSFYKDDTNLATYVVKNEKSVTETPTWPDSNTKVICWKLADGTKVAPLNYTITEDTIFYAEYGEILPFTFDGEKLTGYTGSLSEVTIPSSYSIALDGTFVVGNDYLVTTIGIASFSQSTVEKVIFSEGILFIDSGAFSQCSNLSSIVIPCSFNKFYISAFFNCQSLSFVYYRGSEVDWYKISGTLQAFSGTGITNSSYIFNYTEA